jgi:hypothetical protein
MPERLALNQSTADWYSELRQWTGEIGGSVRCVYQYRVVQFRWAPIVNGWP